MLNESIIPVSQIPVSQVSAAPTLGTLVGTQTPEISVPVIGGGRSIPLSEAKRLIEMELGYSPKIVSFNGESFDVKVPHTGTDYRDVCQIGFNLYSSTNTVIENYRI